MQLFLQISMNANTKMAGAAMSVLMTMEDTTAHAQSHLNSPTITTIVEVRKFACMLEFFLTLLHFHLKKRKNNQLVKR